MVPVVPIILIDDNPAWRETLSEYLQEKGFQVQSAEGGVPGLALVEKNGLGLAVIDLNMPGMGGMELLRQLRRYQPKVAVLVLSSEDDPKLPEQAIAEGAKAFLSKTQSPRELLRELMQTLVAASIEIAVVALFSTSSKRLLRGPREVGRFLLPSIDVQQN